MCGEEFNRKGGEDLQHPRDNGPKDCFGRRTDPKGGCCTDPIPDHSSSSLINPIPPNQVVLGHPITFECPLVPNPAATDVEMSWTREGIPLSAQAQEVQLLDNGHRLTVLSAQREDDVRFACSAENLAGQTGREFQLTVLGGSD